MIPTFPTLTMSSDNHCTHLTVWGHALIMRPNPSWKCAKEREGYTVGDWGEIRHLVIVIWIRSLDRMCWWRSELHILTSETWCCIEFILLMGVTVNRSFLILFAPLKSCRDGSGSWHTNYAPQITSLYDKVSRYSGNLVILWKLISGGPRLLDRGDVHLDGALPVAAPAAPRGRPRRRRWHGRRPRP